MYVPRFDSSCWMNRFQFHSTDAVEKISQLVSSFLLYSVENVLLSSRHSFLWLFCFSSENRKRRDDNWLTIHIHDKRSMISHLHPNDNRLNHPRKGMTGTKKKNLTKSIKSVSFWGTLWGKHKAVLLFLMTPKPGLKVKIKVHSGKGLPSHPSKHQWDMFFPESIEALSLNSLYSVCISSRVSLTPTDLQNIIIIYIRRETRQTDKQTSCLLNTSRKDSRRETKKYRRNKHRFVEE